MRTPTAVFVVFVLISASVCSEETHLERSKRFLIWKEGNSRVQWIMGVGVPVDLKDETVIIGIVLKALYLLPFNSTVYTNPDVVYARKRRSISRWDIYGLLAEAADLYGYGGKSCILRTVCEAADTVIDRNNGLLDEIAHAVFTPTTTSEDVNHHTDNEYYAAHQIGTTVKGRCQDFFPDCKASFMDMFSRISSI